MYAVLSSTIVLEPGTFSCRKMTLEEAKFWIEKRNPTCYTTHETVKILGITPSKYRKACRSYLEALCVKPKHRLQEFKKQYTVEEILEGGVEIFLIKKLQ